MNTTRIAISTIIGAALLAAPSRASADDLAKTVEKLETAIKKLEKVESNLSDYKASNAAAVRQLQDDVDGLKTSVRSLEADVKFLRSTLNGQSSTSKREAYDTAPRMGRVKLSNEFVEEMSVVLNGTAYRLLPGQTRTINVPAGPFTYQVLQLQRTVQERAIAAGEEKPIRIYTQQP